ncbi:tRNA 2-selenouridine synthase [Clonorchis sinensis]|uniref:tRNA 2-selenouridine synthase n=1 Tax=Clonorchis sinensis TaxID=79923 RepID=A0A8T1MBI2_CLOSI|nr:tRNA 2-selenouridine synthase [Clonorchis sinensis]
MWHFSYNRLCLLLVFSRRVGPFAFASSCTCTRFNFAFQADCMACNNVPKDLHFTSKDTLRDLVEFLKTSTQYYQFRVTARSLRALFKTQQPNGFIVPLRFLSHRRSRRPIDLVTLAYEPYAKDPSWIPAIPPPPEDATDSETAIPWSQFRSQTTRIIDVRSPSEFSRDHIHGAINLPVLDDHEHALVGRRYAEGNILQSRFIGASLICANLSNILNQMAFDETVVALGNQKSEMHSAPSILVYCLRGGQRSNSLATLLSEIGWPGRIGLLLGGFHSWRRLLLRQLDAWPRWRMPGQFWIIAGLTGSGKSLVLSELSKVNETVLDLEELAEHKGSIFGTLETTNSSTRSLISQCQFETRLHNWFMTQQCTLPTFSPVWLECESRSVGPLCRLSDGLWQRLRSTNPNVGTHRVWLDVPEDARIAWIIECYSQFTRDLKKLDQVLLKLSSYHSSKRLAEWRQAVERGDFTSLVASLLRHHYDPLYQKSRKQLMLDAEQHGLAHRLSLSSVDRNTVRSSIIPVLLDFAESYNTSPSRLRNRCTAQS